MYAVTDFERRYKDTVGFDQHRSRPRWNKIRARDIENVESARKNTKPMPSITVRCAESSGIYGHMARDCQKRSEHNNQNNQSNEWSGTQRRQVQAWQWKRTRSKGNKCKGNTPWQDMRSQTDSSWENTDTWDDSGGLTVAVPVRGKTRLGTFSTTTNTTSTYSKPVEFHTRRQHSNDGWTDDVRVVRLRREKDKVSRTR